MPLCPAWLSGTGAVPNDASLKPLGWGWRVLRSWGSHFIFNSGPSAPTSHQVGPSLGNIQSEHMLLPGRSVGVLGRGICGSGGGRALFSGVVATRCTRRTPCGRLGERPWHFSLWGGDFTFKELSQDRPLPESLIGAPPAERLFLQQTEFGGYPKSSL